MTMKTMMINCHMTINNKIIWLVVTNLLFIFTYLFKFQSQKEREEKGFGSQRFKIVF